MRNNNLIICLIACTIFIILPLCICSFIIGVISSNLCVHINNIESYIPNYFYNLGIGNIITIIVLIICYVFILFDFSKTASIIGIMTVSIINALFGIAWFSIGVKILLYVNIDCVGNGFIYITYALVLWFVSVCNFIKDCRSHNTNTEYQNL